LTTAESFRFERLAGLAFRCWSRPSFQQGAVDLKTAKALGLTIPETLLATADEVIQ
jgi:hypothetical protein